MKNDPLRDALNRMDDPAGAFEAFVQFTQLPDDERAQVLAEMRKAKGEQDHGQ